MKQCPKCRRNYTDETLNFCLEDGARLIDSFANDFPTVNLPLRQNSDDEPATKHLRIHSESSRVSTENDAPSIAVLPLVSIGSDEENEYFCEGLAEELLNALAKINELKVAARTSAFSFKGKNVDAEEIGRVLRVKTILEGSVRKSGNRIRITMQLINASDGYHLWSEKYDREMKDIFDVQDEIALAVVAALKIKLLGDDKKDLFKRYTDNTEAYELYLKGRYHLHKHTAEGWLKAVEFFERAIEVEPEYAPAYAGLASVLAYAWFFSILPNEKTIIPMRAAAVRALEIDGDLDEAHTVMARLYFYYDWDFAAADREFRRAIELNSVNAESHHQYGIFLACMERPDEAVREGQKALELDPLSILVNFQVGWTLVFSNRLDEAIKFDQKMLEMEPDFHGAYWQMAIALFSKGDFEAALEAARKSYSLGGYRHPLSNIGVNLAALGKREEALDVIAQLIEMRKQQPVSACNIARIYDTLGDADKAFEWLEKGIEERDGEMPFIKMQSNLGAGKFGWRSVRRDARFQDILRRVGLTMGETAQGKAENEAGEAQTRIISSVAAEE